MSRLLSSHLMTAHLPEPDLLIRTSGEVRLSNFMLWQLAYAEFSFTDVLWPDFDELCMLNAIEEFQLRNRRFGSVEGEGRRLKQRIITAIIALVLIRSASRYRRIALHDCSLYYCYNWSYMNCYE